MVSIADDLENGTDNARYEYGSPAFLGVGLEPHRHHGRRRLPRYAGRPGRASAPVTASPGSAARSVSTAAGLRQAIRAYSPGDSVRLIWTDTSGTSHIATVTLIAGPVA